MSETEGGTNKMKKESPERGRNVRKSAKGTWKVKIAGLAVLLAAAAGGILFMQKSDAIAAETITVSAENVTDIYTEEGTITFGGEYYVTAQASGAVREVLVQENEEVQAGDVLFLIDSTDYAYQKRLAESALLGYEAQLERSRMNQLMTASPQEYLKNIKQEIETRRADYTAAKSVYDADKVLFEAGDISRVQLEAAAASYETASLAWQQTKSRYEESMQVLTQLKAEGMEESAINRRFYETETEQLGAQIEAQKTAIEQMEEQISRCEVRTEKAGRIRSLPVKEMSVVQAGQTCAVLSQRERAGVDVDVLTNIAPYIKEETAVTVILKLRGKEENYRGTVREVYDYASKGNSALGLDEYRVRVKIDLDENGLDEEQAAELGSREGYGVYVDFCLYQGENVIAVPAGAVFEVNGENFVYRLQDGCAVKVPVDVEYRTGTQTVISDGISHGDAIICQADAEDIYEGVKVK